MEPSYTFADFKKTCNELNMYVGVETLLEALNLDVKEVAYNINAFSLKNGPFVIYGCGDRGLLISINPNDVINFSVSYSGGAGLVRAFSLEMTSGGIRLIPDFKNEIDPLALAGMECVFYVVDDLTDVVEGMQSKPEHEKLSSPKVRYC